MADVLVSHKVVGGQLERTTFKGCAFHIHERTGDLSIFKGTELLVVYAAGCWQTVADLGAIIQLRNETAAAAQQEPPSENPRRRQEERAIQKT